MAQNNRIALKLLLWLVVGGLLVSTLGYFLYRKAPVMVTVTSVTRGRVEQTVTSISSGTVKPKIDSMVASGVMGTIQAIHFKEGDRVNSGDILVELNHDELDAQVALTEANLKVGQSRVAQARLLAGIYERVSGAQVGQATANLDQSRSNFNRLKALSDQNAVSKSEFDRALLALRVAEEGSTSALANQSEMEVRREEIRMAESTVEQLEAAVAVAKATREKTFVRAPFSGIVAKAPVDVGEAVAIGMPLVQLVDTSDCYVKAPFDEANAAQIQVGQKARLGLDAYRGQKFMGRVTYISDVISINPDLSRTLDVNIEIDEEKDKFIPGMSVDALIIVQEKDDVVYVPTESIMRDRFIYLAQGGRAVWREVKVGAGNLDTMEILEGLQVGDTIVTSVSIKELQNGVKLQVVNSLEE